MSDLPSHYDITIVGAGPAGMAAAITASEHGAKVLLLDSQPGPGGQIYRQLYNSPLADLTPMGEDYQSGLSLIERFNQCSADKLFNTQLWQVASNGQLHYSQDDQIQQLSTETLLIAAGAMERPNPIPGWQLPGVMTAGGAQVMLKRDGIAAEGAVFAGSGPLLYLVAAQYLRFGVQIKAFIDTTPYRQYLGAGTALPAALSAAGQLTKGLGLIGELLRSHVPVYRNASKLAICGDDKASGIRFYADGQQHQIDAEHIFLHQGVIPQLNLTRSTGMEHHWCRQQLCWRPSLDNWGQSSIPHIYVAGDSGSILGADAAQMLGTQSALAMLARIGKIAEAERDAKAQALQEPLAKQRRLRKLLDRLYRPRDEIRRPTDATTIVCRCEDQTLGQLYEAFQQGATGPNELKAQTRCGMGPCQGRQCGHTVSELLSQWREAPLEQVGYYRLRSPVGLLSLTELGGFQPGKEKHS